MILVGFSRLTQRKQTHQVIMMTVQNERHVRHPQQQQQQLQQEEEEQQTAFLLFRVNSVLAVAARVWT